MKWFNRSSKGKIKKEFIESRKWFFNSPEGATLIKALEAIVGEVKAAYFVMWLPEQCEDTYWVLVNGKIIVEVEIDVGWRFGETALMDEILDITGYEDVEGYRKSIQKSEEDVLQLKIALELSKDELKSFPNNHDFSKIPMNKIRVTDENLGDVISQFTISKEELKPILESDRVAKAPIRMVRASDEKHKNGSSQFVIPKEELIAILEDPRVIQSPVGTVVSAPNVKSAKNFFARETDIGKIIGNIRSSDGSDRPTTFLAVITDKSGDLITAYPGPFKRESL